jgi:hypothetical protein
MRTLTDIEVQYVSGGKGKAPIPPAVPAPNEGTGSSWPDWLQDIGKDIAAGAARMADAIAGLADNIGEALVNVTANKAESTEWELGPLKYSNTTCAPGQDKEGGDCKKPPGDD